MNLFYIILACFLWSLIPVVTKYLLQKKLIDPQSLSFLRLLISFLFILLLSLSKKAILNFTKLSKKEWLWLIIGGFGLGLNFIVYNLGINYTAANVACLLEHVSTITIMVILGCVILNERFNLQRGIGLILCIIGLILVILNGVNIAAIVKSDHFIGNILVILSGILWAGYGLSQKVLSNKVNVLAGLILMLGIGIILSGTSCFFQVGLMNTNFKTISMVLFLGIFCTGIPYILLAKGFRRISVGTVGIATASIPVLTIIFAYLLLGELLTKYIIIGGGLIILGMILDTV
jgi:drug/metabolite transporter (DMT)-like permease